MRVDCVCTCTRCQSGTDHCRNRISGCHFRGKPDDVPPAVPPETAPFCRIDNPQLVCANRQEAPR